VADRQLFSPGFSICVRSRLVGIQFCQHFFFDLLFLTGLLPVRYSFTVLCPMTLKFAKKKLR
jgi:hypothetical protein